MSISFGSKNSEKLIATYTPINKANNEVTSFISPLENPFINPYNKGTVIIISK